MKNIFATFALAALLLPQPAQASFDSVPPLAAFKDVEGIPGPLAQQLSNYNTKYEEQYIAQVLQPLRQETASKNSLTAADVEKREEKGRRAGRSYRANEIMGHDRDFDGKVSLAEITESMAAQRGNMDPAEMTPELLRSMKDQAETTFKRYDADKDGIVTLKEAAEEGTRKSMRRSPRRTGQLAALLALDPDKDGTLTVAELTALAKKAFATADKDKDGVISAKEQQAIRELGLSEPAYGEGCAVPAPAKGDKIVLLSADAGGSLSPLKFAERRRGDMSVVEVNIAKGEGKIYLAAASTGYVIWKLTGDTARVSRLLLYGQSDNETGKMIAGATGIPADRVSYLKRSDVDDEMGGYTACMPHIYRHHFTGKAAKKMERQVEQAGIRIFGRKPDVQAAFAQPYRIDIAADGSAAAPKELPEAQQAPGDADAATWNDFIALFPGGVVAIKPQDVVTELALEERGLLPGLAGVAQLVKSGHLQREKDPDGASLVLFTGGGQQPLVVRSPDRPVVMQDRAEGRQVRLMDDSRYRVVKAPDEYPQTYGGYLVRYQLGKDMEIPRDRQGCFAKDGEEDNNCR